MHYASSSHAMRNKKKNTFRKWSIDCEFVAPYIFPVSYYFLGFIISSLWDRRDRKNDFAMGVSYQNPSPMIYQAKWKPARRISNVEGWQRIRMIWALFLHARFGPIWRPELIGDSQMDRQRKSASKLNFRNPEFKALSFFGIWLGWDWIGRAMRLWKLPNLCWFCFFF